MQAVPDEFHLFRKNVRTSRGERHSFGENPHLMYFPIYATCHAECRLAMMDIAGRKRAEAEPEERTGQPEGARRKIENLTKQCRFRDD